MPKKIGNFRYYFSQAMRSVVRNGLMSVTSIFTVLCCLLILGVFLILSININYIANQVQNQCEIQAFMKDGTSAQQLSEIGNQLRQIDNVREAVAFSKQDALDYMRELFGENADALDGLEDDNPFRDSYKITLNDLSQVEPTIKAIENISGVADVENKQALMDNILNMTNTIKHVSLWIMLLLSLVSIFIIANTIKLAVFARRKEINVMKFVGATDWFIRWPFVIEGIIIGIIGGLIAFGLISWGYIAALKGLSGYEMDMFRFVPYQTIWYLLLGAFVSLGAVIGAIGSGFSIRKHLHV